MADPGDRRSPRFPKPNTATRPPATKRRTRAPTQLPLPSASESLPTPLSSSSATPLDNEAEPVPLLPPFAHTPIAPHTDSPEPVAPSSNSLDSPLTPLPSSPASSDTSDDMPATMIADGVFSNHGRLPHIADSKEAATSLGGPRNCARLLHAFRAYGTIAKLQDGDIMDTFIHAFKSPKMQQDLRRTAAAKSFTFRTMTYEQFFDVLRDTFIRGGSTKMFDDFQHRVRVDDEHPMDYYNGLEESNFDFPAELRVSQKTIIDRTVLSFGRKFTNFCRGKDQFAKLLKWTLPTLDESDEASVDAYNASIKGFTTLLTTAWDAHRDLLDEFAEAVSSGMKALDNDLRKRGLSTTSHSAQLPEPKRAAFASNAAQPPRPSAYAQQPAYAQQSAPPPRRWANQVTAVNAISSRPAGRVLTKADVLAKKEVLVIPLDLNPKLVGHFITITIFSGCYWCFEIRANHRASDCPHRGQSFKPPFPLDCTECEDYIIAQTYFTHHNEERERRGITLQEIVANVDPAPFNISPAYTQTARRAPARAPATNANSIPVGTHVNAVPAQVAHISPDSSFEGPPAQAQPVNYVAYTQDDLARGYASTGLRGRVNHVANVRRHSDMGPPAVPHAASVPSQPVRGGVSASFGDFSDDDAGYDDDYISQPAPPARSRAARDEHVGGTLIHTHRSTSKARAYARSSSRSLWWASPIADRPIPSLPPWARHTLGRLRRLLASPPPGLGCALRLGLRPRLCSGCGASTPGNGPPCTPWHPSPLRTGVLPLRPPRCC